MAQISYGTITITDTTDIERIYPVYCKGGENTAPSLQPLSNWSETVSQAGGSGDYIWQRIVTKKQNVAVIANDYSDAVRLTGDVGSSLTIIKTQYAQTQNENGTPSYGDAIPSPINEGWWLWTKTIYSDNSEVIIKIKQGQKGETGQRGTSILKVTTAPTAYTTTQGGFTPSYRMSLSTVKSQSGKDEVLIGDIIEYNSNHYRVGYVNSSYIYLSAATSIKGADGQTYYTWIKYAPNDNPSDSQIDDSPTGMTYIGIYTGTSSSAPTIASSYAPWVKYIGTDGAPGVSITGVKEIYFLKRTSDSVPQAPDNTTNIISTSTSGGVWSTAVPNYESGAIYYTSIQTDLDNGTYPHSAARVNQGLTDANQKALDAYNTSIARDTEINAVKAQAKHFWWDSEGAHIAAGSNTTSVDNITQGQPDTYSFNALTAPGFLKLRYKNIDFTQLATNSLIFYRPATSGSTYVQGKKAMELTADALTFYKPLAYNSSNEPTAAAQLSSTGLNITDGTIQLGSSNSSSTSDGNITLSNTDFSRSINNISRDYLRLAIGGNFGVKNDGTLYASNATISGKIVVSSDSNLSAGLSDYSTTSQMNTAIGTATNDMATKTYVGNQGYQNATQVSTAVSNGISSASVSDLSDGSSYSTTNEMNTAIGNATNDNFISATILYYASNSTTQPTKPSTHITTNSASTYERWNIALPTYSTTYPYLYICTEYKTKDGSYFWTSVEQTNYTSAVSAIKTKADAAIKTQVNLYYASNSTTPPAKPSAHVATNSASTYGEWNIALPTYSTTYPYLYTCKETLTNGGTYAWTSVEQSTYAAATAAIKTTAEAAAPKSTAIKRTQRIYYRTNSSTPPPTPGTATANWVINGNVDTESQPWIKYDTWSTRVPPMADDVNINSEGGATEYLYLWTCEQKEVVSATNPVSYTEVLLDESNTIIDGSHIIIGSVTANKLNAADINAWGQLSVGAFATDDRNNILNSQMLNVQTYQGNIVSFENENNALIQKLTTTIEPFQSGGGTPGIDNVRSIQGWNSIKITNAGKNLIYFPPLTNITHNGITYTLSDDNNSLTISGTASNNSQCYSTSINTNYDLMPLGIYPAGTYTVTSYGFVKSNTNDRVVFNAKYADGTSVTGHDGDRISDEQIVTFTATQPFKAAIWCYILSGSTVNCTVTIQMERASELSDYEPYINNICEVSLSNAGTVYGGTLDITTGALKVTKRLLTLDGSTVEGSNAITKFQAKGGNTYGDHYYVIVDDGYLFNATGARWVTQTEGTNAGMICNYGPFLSGSNQTALSYNSYISDNGTKLRLYMCFPTSMNLNTLALANTWLTTHNLQFIYPLASPITYILSPQQIATLLNTNNIWSNSGNIIAQIAYGSNDMIQALNILNEADENTAKQITNFISADSSGIMVYDGRGGIKQQPSDVIEGTHNVLIDQNSIDIRTGTTVHASFGEEGLKLYLSGDQTNPIAQYGETTIIGQEHSFHIEIDSQQLGFYDGKRIQDNNQIRPAIAYIQQDKMFIEKSVVAQSLSVGRAQSEEDQQGNSGKGQWSWQVHEVNGLNNLSLKWMG